VSRSVEARGLSVEEATAQALDELGLSEDEVTVEVLAEGRRGLFGGAKRAHVRVTARDGAAPAAEASARQGPRDAAAGSPPAATTEAAEDQEEEASPEERLQQLDEEADLAADFVEGLLDLLDLPGDIELDTSPQHATVNVVEVGSGLLIGRRGATLDALQELVRGAVQRQTQRRCHVRVDIEGYRARQLEKLKDKCRDAIAQVRETGEPVRLEPMDPYERKLMHDLVAGAGGVASASEGNEPRRRVVIKPADEG
jgi:spoIIIJ-associated protein